MVVPRDAFLGFVFFCSTVLFVATAVDASEPIVGERLFNQNCKACHALDRASAGPSLVEIRTLYPEHNSDAFVAWSIEPGKKRAEMIQMPSMAHVGKESLQKVHEYILLISEHVKERKAKPKFSYKAPPLDYPFVKRQHQINLGPSAVVIGLNNVLTLAWDTAAARLGYVYPSGLYLGPLREPGNKNLARILYQETAHAFWSFERGEKPQFKGYRLVDGLPEFYYLVGSVEITEQILAGRDPRAFTRRFTVTGLNDDMFSLDLESRGNINIYASSGRWEGNRLVLKTHEALTFEIEVEIR